MITGITPKITPIAARPRLIGVVGVILGVVGVSVADPARVPGDYAKGEIRHRVANILIAVRPRLTGEVSLLIRLHVAGRRGRRNKRWRDRCNVKCDTETLTT